MQITMTLTNRGGEVRVLGVNAAMRFLLEESKKENSSDKPKSQNAQKEMGL